MGSVFGRFSTPKQAKSTEVCLDLEGELSGTWNLPSFL
jgi:hypothetical protein